MQEQSLKTIEKFYQNGVDAAFITGEIRRILGDKAIEVLLGHAWSNKREVRISAILLLGLMKDEAAYGPLLDISHEEEFAEDAKKALVFIGSGNPESLLKLFHTDNAHQLRFICDVPDRLFLRSIMCPEDCWKMTTGTSVQWLLTASKTRQQKNRENS
jgi:hypothetical protein